MSTPRVTTEASSRRILSSSLSAYERVLGAAIAGALAVVAMSAILVPVGPSPVSTEAGASIGAHQPARGKATLPASPSVSSLEVSPLS